MNQDDGKLKIDIGLLLAELGLDNIPEEEKQKIAQMMEETIKAKVKLYLFDTLPEEDLKHLESIGNDGDKVMEYLTNTKGIDMGQVLIAVAQESREEFMRDVEYIRGLLDSEAGTA